MSRHGPAGRPASRSCRPRAGIAPACGPWSACATFGTSLLFVGLALWSRQGLYTYLGGLCINLVGVILWGAWVSAGVNGRGLGITDMAATLASTQVLCCALGAGLWSGLER